MLIRGDEYETLKKIFKKLGNLWVELTAKGIIIEPIAYNIEDYKQRLKQGYSFIKTIEQEKKVLLKC